MWTIWKGQKEVVASKSMGPCPISYIIWRWSIELESKPLENYVKPTFTTVLANLSTFQEMYLFLKWLGYVLHCLWLFFAVNNKVVQTCILCEKISLNKVIHFLSILLLRVSPNISRLLPNLFAVILDGQTTLEAHHVALFCHISRDRSPWITVSVLNFSPLEDGTTQNSDNHITTLEILPKVFD